ncbi:hypothetical protein A3A75_02570 [Candidatus Woesebacteria bacterium RIFCSPLOWO2_01_FULL_39_10]|uniref:Uncharacterized protein n=1 Tax=Candidatus Woesebacteria bacterium RIFCSPLOWO2_01_FULL_39_10 TaxID=1802516 RepID=A0A1F8B7A5_9BACT|nr:MAG: hypothetical protein A3A75_02570 [Candidatus Woesebacteria bacterium RIFCSPLOWO2_01_FULL_39_10]
MEERIQSPKIIIGLLDDMAPDGSPNTACQNYLEQELQSGHYEVVMEEIMPGVFKKIIILRPVETKPDGQR